MYYHAYYMTPSSAYDVKKTYIATFITLHEAREFFLAKAKELLFNGDAFSLVFDREDDGDPDDHYMGDGYMGHIGYVDMLSEGSINLVFSRLDQFEIKELFDLGEDRFKIAYSYSKQFEWEYYLFSDYRQENRNTNLRIPSKVSLLKGLKKSKRDFARNISWKFMKRAANRAERQMSRFFIDEYL